MAYWLTPLKRYGQRAVHIEIALTADAPPRCHGTRFCELCSVPPGAGVCIHSDRLFIAMRRLPFCFLCRPLSVVDLSDPHALFGGRSHGQIRPWQCQCSPVHAHGQSPRHVIRAGVRRLSTAAFPRPQPFSAPVSWLDSDLLSIRTAAWPSQSIPKAASTCSDSAWTLTLTWRPYRLSCRGRSRRRITGLLRN